MIACRQAEGSPALPSRGILVGASGEGKTHLVTELITKAYRGCFAQVYLWSPSAFLDPGYDRLKSYVEKHAPPLSGKWLYDSYDPSELQQVIDEQTGVTRLAKEKGLKKMHQICILIDDFADSTEFTRNSKQLWGLFARGRHVFISTFILSQRWRSIAPICRLNASVVYVHRLRNSKDIDAICEELGGMRGPPELRAALIGAVEDAPHSYLKIDLMAPPEERWQIRNDGSYV